ncbi:hypothetical protein TI04_11080 [Achromatium sp. WMS2]|nr:hypothetical protein TI04_11080 [Achromatium sp. WMS2]
MWSEKFLFYASLKCCEIVLLGEDTPSKSTEVIDTSDTQSAVKAKIRATNSLAFNLLVLAMTDTINFAVIVQYYQPMFVFNRYKEKNYQSQ